MRALLLSAVALLLASPSMAQGVPFPPSDPPPTVSRPAPPPRAAPQLETFRRGPRRLGGPRTGFTVLSSDAVQKVNEAFGEQTCTYPQPNYETGYYPEPICSSEERISSGFPVVSQFGWQFERRMFQSQSGLTGVTEWVVLVGGAERGLLLPSATFLAGIRAPSGLEIGVGPNVSLSGAAYAITVGMNNEIGEVNLPINVAAVLGQDGPRLSLLVGFNVSDSRY